MSQIVTDTNSIKVATQEDLAEACFHCGTPCPDASKKANGNVFCCQGCVMVYDLLRENGLTNFYQIQPKSGIRVNGAD